MIQSLDLLEQTTAVSKLRRLLSLGKAFSTWCNEAECLI